MRYFVLPREGLSDDLRAALTRGVGLSPQDARACARHCARYGVDDPAAFAEELEEAQAAIAAARLLRVQVRVDWRGRLCYDLPPAHDDGAAEDDEEGWRDDAWLVALVGGASAG